MEEQNQPEETEKNIVNGDQVDQGDEGEVSLVAEGGDEVSEMTSPSNAFNNASATEGMSGPYTNGVEEAKGDDGPAKEVAKEGVEGEDGAGAVVDPTIEDHEISSSFITISMKYDSRSPYKKFIAETICSILKGDHSNPDSDTKKLLLTDIALKEERLNESIQLHKNFANFDDMKSFESTISELFKSNHEVAWLIDEKKDLKIINLVFDINEMLEKVHNEKDKKAVYYYLQDLYCAITDIFNSKYSNINDQDKDFIRRLIEAATLEAREAAKAKGKEHLATLKKPSGMRAMLERKLGLGSKTSASVRSDTSAASVKSDTSAAPVRSDKKYGFKLSDEIDKKPGVKTTRTNYDVKHYFLRKYYEDIQSEYNDLGTGKKDEATKEKEDKVKKEIDQFLEAIHLNKINVMAEQIDTAMKKLYKGVIENNYVTINNHTKSKMMFLEELVDYIRNKHKLEEIHRSKFSSLSLSKSKTKKGGSVKNNRTHKIKKNNKK